MSVGLPPLACTVRGCGLGLRRDAAVLACPAGHAYDVARTGYVNLLQPQDRRSPSAGDSKAALDARACLLDAGIGRILVDDIRTRTAALGLPDGAVVADLGSGSGHLLGTLAQSIRLSGVGIDISTAAAEAAARRFPALTWVVANADRRIPLLDRRVHLVLSLHGRRNAPECARIIATGGFLVVAVPAADDVIELRTWIAEHTGPRDRSERVLQDHEGGFTLVDRTIVRERHHLDRTALLALLRATYRGERHSAATRVDALAGMEVTLASELFLFAPRRHL
jgi:23S rRNA (guanine745-N1)-methyltransferase